MLEALEEVDVVSRGRAYLDSLAGRRVTVAGLARSGVAAARLLRAAGHDAEVLIDDARLVDRAAAVRAGVGWSPSWSS